MHFGLIGCACFALLGRYDPSGRFRGRAVAQMTLSTRELLVAKPVLWMGGVTWYRATTGRCSLAGHERTSYFGLYYDTEGDNGVNNDASTMTRFKASSYCLRAI